MYSPAQNCRPGHAAQPANAAHQERNREQPHCQQHRLPSSSLIAGDANCSGYISPLSRPAPRALAYESHRGIVPGKPSKFASSRSDGTQPLTSGARNASMPDLAFPEKPHCKTLAWQRLASESLYTAVLLIAVQPRDPHILRIVYCLSNTAHSDTFFGGFGETLATPIAISEWEAEWHGT